MSCYSENARCILRYWLVKQIHPISWISHQRVNDTQRTHILVINQWHFILCHHRSINTSQHGKLVHHNICNINISTSSIDSPSLRNDRSIVTQHRDIDAGARTTLVRHQRWNRKSIWLKSNVPQKETRNRC